MRISDWSSDVCSSDLAVAPAGQVVQRPGNHLLARARLAENQHIGLGPGQRADLFAQAQHRLGLSEQARRQLLPVDRKSVVEGKSVSVRVVLGGSRLIQKKKKYTNRPHTKNTNY